MLSFLKYVLATLVGLVLFCIVGFLLLIGIAAATSDDEVAVKSNSVLKISLDRPLLERDPDDPFEGLDLPLVQQQEGIGLYELREALKKAAKDDRIKGVYLDVSAVQGGYAQIEEVRQMLLEFKESGKFITTYSETYSEGAYLLAAVADDIWMNPAGGLEFNGLMAETPFFKGMLDKIGVEPQVIKVGDFKSAAEPFTNTEYSAPNEAQIASFLNSIYDNYLREVSESRQIPVAELRRISDELLIQLPEDALKHKLVTHLGYFDEVLTDLRQRLSVEEDDDIPFVTLTKYKKARLDQDKEEVNTSRDRIAVIFASGEIQGGEGSESVIGSERIARALRDARLDDKVKAVVLRINSPGGSALASDVMWREVKLTSDVKPIIASMSSVAASGGYYMAMACDTIVAQPTTITGSIGVIGIIPNAQKLLNDKLGITTDLVETSEHADLINVTRPLTEFERSVLQRQVNATYNEFTQKAATGRNLPLDSLQAMAGGRVWSGAEAEARGLVDVLGGLDSAIAIAANAAGLEQDKYRVRFLPEQKNFLEELMNTSEEEFHARILRYQLGEYYPLIQSVQQLKHWQGIQTRLPFELIIR
ncbi:protease-4 [Catalinimonas alkaloidigena]|uniref:Protease-4 n=1 Tax=Catalinimonas alkaloidigena TaxID=1075417 RepID=A0A1G9BVT0_9BACT|nr:signal peptide peptidase SppA [Catalinimonas alkaloidigena]SDK43581.1 protease-4 [Catalinimonas alkaloidigena]